MGACLFFVRRRGGSSPYQYKYICITRSLLYARTDAAAATGRPTVEKESAPSAKAPTQAGLTVEAVARVPSAAAVADEERDADAASKKAAALECGELGSRCSAARSARLLFIRLCLFGLGFAQRVGVGVPKTKALASPRKGSTQLSASCRRAYPTPHEARLCLPPPWIIIPCFNLDRGHPVTLGRVHRFT